MTIMTMMIIMLLITIALMILSFWLPEITPDFEKLSPYECGFDPFGSSRLPFSLRFFLIAILFLLFDLEIALLLPLPWALTTTKPMHSMLIATMIIILLTLGLIYEWAQGGLEWAE
uniref:NADH-ubiquinone oxidoreductase chain 3 n=1 Tax=Diplometopon zarudnyi TaxID=94420 RepID=Q66SX0_DIPZA|nr:NADH dehydrogenase subunit 3 [Diplometopon zarudnyi]AAT08510.1 NADH dehydrogenase subunit 3 [Diplometopon zarudnyi]